MFKLLASMTVAAVLPFALTLLTGSTVMAQEIALPAPGGPGDLTPPPPQKNQKPVPPPPGGNEGPLDPFPNQTPVNTSPVVYTLGTARTTLTGAKDYVFYPSQGYNSFQVVGVVGGEGFVNVNSVTLHYKDGHTMNLNTGLVANYHPNQGRITMLLEANVASVVVNASNASARYQAPGTFRVDVSATHGN